MDCFTLSGGKRWIACSGLLSRVEWMSVCLCVCVSGRIKQGYVAGGGPGLESAYCWASVCLSTLASKHGHCLKHSRYTTWTLGKGDHSESRESRVYMFCVFLFVCQEDCLFLHPQSAASGSLGKNFHYEHDWQASPLRRQWRLKASIVMCVCVFRTLSKRTCMSEAWWALYSTSPCQAILRT